MTVFRYTWTILFVLMAVVPVVIVVASLLFRRHRDDDRAARLPGGRDGADLDGE
jgi:hypothetical protein